MGEMYMRKKVSNKSFKFVSKKMKRGILFVAAILIIGSMETGYSGGVIVSEAHSGRTDSQGGHHDYKNKSGLGSYHYHHGYEAHLHPNGVCPYENGNGTSTTKSSKQSVGSSTTTTSEKKTEPTLKIEDYSLIFETVYYYNNNPDLQASIGNGGQDLLEHFDNYGMAEGRRGSSNFDVKTYRDNNKDLEAAYGDNLKEYYVHYLNIGHKENRTHN